MLPFYHQAGYLVAVCLQNPATSVGVSLSLPLRRCYVPEVIEERDDKRAKSTTKQEFIDQFHCIKAEADS